MKSSLNSVILWGSLFLLFQNGYTHAQPIQLIPRSGSENLDHFQIEAPYASSQDLPEFWEGTPLSIIKTYFPKLPLKLTSPVLRELRTQLSKKKYQELLQNTVYEKSVFSLLIIEGEEEHAKEFLMETDLPDKESMFLDLQWLTGNPRKACEKITNLIRTSPAEEWRKQNIYCLYLNGEGERAKIAAEVLSESNPSTSQLLNTLFDSSLKPSLNKSIAKSPFLLTVWLESKQDISEDEIQELSSPSLAMIARSEKASLSTRLLAAEKAFQQGSFKAKDFLPLLEKEPEDGFWGKAFHEVKSPKTESLLPLFERAEQEGRLGLMGQVFSTALAAINPSPETLPLAPFMIRALLQSEKKESAKKWGAYFMREAPDEAIAVAPLLHLAFPENKWSESQIQAWQAYESRVHPKTAAQHSYELRRILGALSEPSGQPVKGESPTPSWRQEKALFDEQVTNLLASAAASKRQGEVILLVLTMIGETPLHELSVDRLVLILKALNKGGFEKQARLLALEYLLTRIQD